ncbi:uncharacterized protein LOC143922242 isoform X2 [Arctopsyche grandis]|uniref:uncharacterized protein LOC143922242 isoform X2 n=1 Tax=Arctopsyche grandis TaxID=121162 RepID=UPI00406D841F
MEAAGSSRADANANANININPDDKVRADDEGHQLTKLRQENEELRKQIKNYKLQLNDVTQDCSALNNRLEIFDAHNTYLKSEINKLLLKYGDENNEHIQDMLKTPEITNQNTYTCPNCRNNKDRDSKNVENTISTPETENPLFSEGDEKYSLMMDDTINDGKNVEVLTEMISKIFSELQTLKGEFVKHNEGADCKELPELLMTADQICQLKIYTLNKQLEKEKSDKKILIKKLEQANLEISMLHDKIKDEKSDELLHDET